MAYLSLPNRLVTNKYFPILIAQWKNLNTIGRKKNYPKMDEYGYHKTYSALSHLGLSDFKQST